MRLDALHVSVPKTGCGRSGVVVRKGQIESSETLAMNASGRGIRSGKKGAAQTEIGAWVKQLFRSEMQMHGVFAVHLEQPNEADGMNAELAALHGRPQDCHKGSTVRSVVWGHDNLMRTRGEGGLEKIGDIWYFSFYNLNGKQVRRSSKSSLKSVAIAKLQAVREALRNGHEPASLFKLRYEDLRAILVADYTAHGKAVMAGEDIVIAGKKGILKPLDDYFTGMAVRAITTYVLRGFVADRKAHGVSGPSCNRYFARLRRMFKLAQREGKVSFHTSRCQRSLSRGTDSSNAQTSSGFGRRCPWLSVPR